MSEKILVPELGESIIEATVSKWLKNKGDKISVDESIVELETDKVNLEVPAPTSGILIEVNSKDGDTVKAGEVLGVISQGDIKNEKNKIKENKISVDINKKKETQKIKNIIKPDIEKKLEQKNNVEPLILNNEEPLVLTNEVVEKKNIYIK